MIGKITHINKAKGIAAVETNTEGFSVFTFEKNSNINIGDNVGWIEIQPIGKCVLISITQEENIKVSFDAHNMALGHLPV